ncbi:hypothetical protein ACQPYE_37255 [Actinosynnema sp. CA-299493]
MSRSATATLTALGVGAAGELTEAPVRALPVRGELAGLLPWGGLRRGSTVSVRGSTSLLFALMAAATAEGCWAAVIGLPGCGALAAAESGVAVHRLALVPRPGRDQGEVEKTVAALLDGFDLVVPVTPATSRKLSARARHRKAVLLPFTVSWPTTGPALPPAGRPLVSADSLPTTGLPLVPAGSPPSAGLPHPASAGAPRAPGATLLPLSPKPSAPTTTAETAV